MIMIFFKYFIKIIFLIVFKDELCIYLFYLDIWFLMLDIELILNN